MKDRPKARLSFEIEFEGHLTGARQLYLRLENELRKTHLSGVRDPKIRKGMFQGKPRSKWLSVEIPRRAPSGRSKEHLDASRQINDLEVTELELSTKTLRALLRVDFLTVGNLRVRRPEELQALVFGLGQKGIEEIQLALEEHGVQLKE